MEFDRFLAEMALTSPVKSPTLEVSMFYGPPVALSIEDTGGPTGRCLRYYRTECDRNTLFQVMKNIYDVDNFDRYGFLRIASLDQDHPRARRFICYITNSYEVNPKLDLEDEDANVDQPMQFFCYNVHFLGYPSYALQVTTMAMIQNTLTGITMADHYRIRMVGIVHKEAFVCAEEFVALLREATHYTNVIEIEDVATQITETLILKDTVNKLPPGRMYLNEVSSD